MLRTSCDIPAGAFSWWLRTGALPPVRGEDGVELKFNPWHDPANGRFTFAGSGRHYAGGERTERQASAGGSHGAPEARHGKRRGAQHPAIASPLKAGGRAAALRAAIARRGGRYRPDPVSEFIGGVGEGLYGVAEDTVAGVTSMLTTHPATTLRNATLNAASVIDSAIAAEDTPTRVHVLRAADASARDVGRNTAALVANVALSGVSGAGAIRAVGKGAARVSPLRHINRPRVRETFPPANIGWVKETLRSKKRWKAYNDTATGSLPGLAPTLMRTLPDGSKRPVKFDGVDGDYVIDRKWKIVDAPHFRAQVLRQVEALTQNKLFAVWEVPNENQKLKGLKLFKKMGVTRIKIRVVEP